MFRINRNKSTCKKKLSRKRQYQNKQQTHTHTHLWACGELPPRNNWPQQVVGSPYLSTKEECDLKKRVPLLFFLGEQVDSIVVSNNIIIRNELKRFRGLIYFFFFFYCHLTCKGGHFPDSHVETTSFRRRTKKNSPNNIRRKKGLTF